MVVEGLVLGSEPGPRAEIKACGASGPSLLFCLLLGSTPAAQSPAGLVSVENWVPRFGLSPMAAVHKVPGSG